MNNKTQLNRDIKRIELLQKRILAILDKYQGEKAMGIISIVTMPDNRPLSKGNEFYSNIVCLGNPTPCAMAVHSANSENEGEGMNFPQVFTAELISLEFPDALDILAPE